MKILITSVILLLVLVFGTLIKNDAHLLQSPGFLTRTRIFLTSNVAETSDDPVLPELKTPVFPLTAQALYQRVLQSAIDLNWQIIDNNSETLTAQFIVQSVAFAFKDDILVRVVPVDNTHSALYLHSSSRVGKADFAANSAHIQALIKGI